MNKRIRELAEQAVEETQLMMIMEYKNFESKLYEKFAELIVRECAKFLEENSGYDESNNAWHPEPEDLLKHFGVEE